MTYYDILHIPYHASTQEIHDAYRSLAKKLHPDVSSDPNAEEQFKALNEAYHVLKNAKTRSAYDASIHAHAESGYRGHTRYQGSRYRDPSTWYDPHVYGNNTQTEEPDEKVHPPEKRTKTSPHTRHILIYIVIILILLIFTQLFLIPTLYERNTQSARDAYQMGNDWMGEWEYQKAIESYEKTITLRPDFVEAWRAKGYVELIKGVELQTQDPGHARSLYRAAIESLRVVMRSDRENGGFDPDTIKNLGNAYERLEMWKEAEAVYVSASMIMPYDPEIEGRLQSIRMYLLGFSKPPPMQLPMASQRSRSTGSDMI